MGHTFPVPVYLWYCAAGPDTDTIPHNVDGVYQGKAYEYCAGYQYHDKTIVGFSHTHMKREQDISDLGDILVMPTTRTVKIESGYIR